MSPTHTVTHPHRSFPQPYNDPLLQACSVYLLYISYWVCRTPPCHSKKTGLPICLSLNLWKTLITLACRLLFSLESWTYIHCCNDIFQFNPLTSGFIKAIGCLQRVNGSNPKVQMSRASFYTHLPNKMSLTYLLCVEISGSPLEFKTSEWFFLPPSYFRVAELCIRLSEK